jgi:SPP1 gp7 family putative phage head morphogenesis protein
MSRTVAERQWRAAQARLEDLDRELLRALARGYDEVIRELRREVERALRQKVVDPARLDRIERSVRERLEELAALAASETERRRLEAAERALDDVRAYIAQIQRASPYPFEWAEPWSSAEQAMAVAFRGTDLETLYRRANWVGWERAKSALFAGITLGRNPVETARLVARALDISLARAITIARTETINAYRAAAVASYQANSAIVGGYRWVAQLDRYTCLLCALLHGSTFPLSQPVRSHPRCRCTVVPVLRPPWDQLEPDFGRGVDVLLADEQRLLELAGPTRAALLKRGVDPETFWRLRNHPVYGPTPELVPLSELLRLEVQ